MDKSHARNCGKAKTWLVFGRNERGGPHGKALHRRSSQVRRRKSAAQSGLVPKVLLKSLASAGPSIQEALDEGCRRGCIIPTRGSTTHSFSSSLWRLEGAMPSALWIKSHIQGLCAMRHGMAFSNRLAFSEALPRKQRKPCARDRAAHDQEARSAHRIDDLLRGWVPVRRWLDLSHGRLRPLRKPVNQLDVIAEWRIPRSRTRRLRSGAVAHADGSPRPRRDR